MNILACYSLATFTSGWNGNWGYSPPPQLLSALLLLGCLSILCSGAVVLAALYERPQFGWGKLKMKWSKNSETVSRLLSYCQRKKKASKESGHGFSTYLPIAFCLVFGLGMIAGRLIPHADVSTFYGLRVLSVLPPDSLKLISPETGPFRADFCPENHIEKYEAKAGYVICRLTYVDRGCMDISGNRGTITWVKNRDAYESTATLNDEDSFKPWPDCHKEEPDARQTRSSVFLSSRSH